MRDDFQVPNIGQAPDAYDRSFFSRMVRNIEMTFVTMRAKGAGTFTTINADEIRVATPLPLPSFTVATLPTAAAGCVAYASNGRKAGEGAGAGTGVLVFRDATAWRACDTGLTVSA